MLTTMTFKTTRKIVLSLSLLTTWFSIPDEKWLHHWLRWLHWLSRSPEKLLYHWFSWLHWNIDYTDYADILTTLKYWLHWLRWYIDYTDYAILTTMTTLIYWLHWPHWYIDYTDYAAILTTLIFNSTSKTIWS